MPDHPLRHRCGRSTAQPARCRRAPRRELPTSAGWQMPVRYSGDLAEHHAVRTRGRPVRPVPHGADRGDRPGRRRRARRRPRRRALRGRGSAAPGTRCSSPMDGGIVDDLVVYRAGEDRYLVVANAANRAPSSTRSRERAAGFDAVVDDESDDVALIAIQGPTPAEICSRPPGFASTRSGDDAASLLRCSDYRASAATRRPPGAPRPHRLHRRGRLRAVPRARRAPRPVGRALAAAGGAGLVPAGLAAATPCASRRAWRCTATSSSRDTTRRRPGSAGSLELGKTATSSAAPRSRPAHADGAACSSASRPRASAPAAPATRVRRRRRRGSGVITSGALSRRRSATRSRWPTSHPALAEPAPN